METYSIYLLYHHYLETASVSEQKCSYLFSSWEQDTQRAALVLYGELVKSLASTSGLEYADTVWAWSSVFITDQ